MDPIDIESTGATLIMSDSLKDRLDIDDGVKHDAVVTCELSAGSFTLKGRLTRHVMSDDMLHVEILLERQMLQEALGCPKITGVCIIMDDDRVHHRDIKSAWVQTRDVMCGASLGQCFLLTLTAKAADDA